MITAIEVEQRIKSKIGSDANIKIEGADCNLAVKIISNFFENMPLIQRQKNILGLFQSEFADGSLHALSVKTYTIKEANTKK